MGLRDLDDRVVPRWAARVRTVSDALAPGPLAALRALDDRYAAAGPLRSVRDAPTAGALLAAAVLLAGAGTASWLAPATDLDPLGTSAAGPVQLGAPVGVDVDQHLAGQRDRVLQLARDTPSDRYLALVSVRDELTVAGTGSLVEGSALAVRRLYVRAPVPGLAELLTVEPGAEPTGTLTALFAATAQRKEQERRELLALARSLPATSGTAPRDARTSYEAAARTAGLEAAAYRTDCRCVLAVVVEGRADELAALLGLPSVRGVEVAPRGTGLPGVDVAPLAPGTTGQVPLSAVPGG